MDFKTNLSQQIKAFDEFWEPFFIYVFNGGFLCFLIHVLIILRMPEVEITKVFVVYVLGAIIGFFLLGSFMGMAGTSKLKTSKVEYKFSFFWYALLAFIGGFIFISLLGFIIIIWINLLRN